jgi:hypothetical protein
MPDADAQSLRVSNAYLAEFAKVEANGLVTAVGAGLRNIRASELPLPLSLSLVLQLERQATSPIALPLEVAVLRPDGSDALRIEGEFASTGETDSINIAISLTVLLDAEGDWLIGASIGEDTAAGAQCRLHVTTVATL